MSSSTGSSSLSLDHLPPPSEQLCYVHCNLCNTVLAVSVPSSSLFKTVTVRCGHCTNLLPVNLRTLLIPPPAASANHLHFSPNPHNLLGGGTPSGAPNYSVGQPSGGAGANDLPSPPTTNRPPEKRQRVPSAYNRFIKDEIQRIKAGNPDISHREAFSAAAKNWAHFPHIHFGLMPDQTVKRTINMRPHHS